MIKKNYIEKENIRFYTEEAVCSKCGGPVEHLPLVFCTFPPQYRYKCTNCDNIESICEYIQPGVIKIEQD